jgi:hypothetical protein
VQSRDFDPLLGARQQSAGDLAVDQLADIDLAHA